MEDLIYNMAEKKIPVPPTAHSPLFVSLTFWLEVIAYLDKRVEMLSNSSGHGQLQVTLKMFKGHITEVNFSEDVRVRGLIEKIDGSIGNPNPMQETKPKE